MVGSIIRKGVKEGVKKGVKMDNRYVYNVVAKCFVHFNFILSIEIPFSVLMF